MPRPSNSDRTGDPPGSGGKGPQAETVLLPTPPELSGAPSYAAEARASDGLARSPSPVFDRDVARLAVLGARYEVLGEAGHGSMGDVYKARDRETGEVVALKLLKPEIASDRSMMERFKNELLFARKITHKNVCRMYDFNRIGGIAYTSMEFVEGESLRTALDRFGGLPVRKAIGVALQICSGLKEAHAQGIVHRDLKPENVMIDAQGNVKIMDFGIARSMEAATRLTGSMVGTPAYMAPEQVSGRPVDYRTDIYSLGLMLYEMFTGVQACQADTPVAAALKQIRETPPPPHEVDPSIPVGVERAILKCLEKEPAKRFQSIADLEKALSAPGITGSWPGLASGPAVAAGPTPVEHLRAARTAPIARGAKTPEGGGLHPAVWLLWGALLVLAALAGARWVSITRTANLIPPPASLPAPPPPPFALRIPPRAATAAAATRPSTPGPAKTNAPTELALPSPSTNLGVDASSRGKPARAEIFPPVELPGKKSARQIELEKAPPAVERRADKAFGENKNSWSGPANTYLWVGRYERQERADNVVWRIKNLGLPVASFERQRQDQKFWVVIAGPFSAKRAPDVLDWLKAQGFREVRNMQPPQGEPRPQIPHQ